MKQIYQLTAALLLVQVTLFASESLLATEPVKLFDGKSFNGWEGNIGSVWRIEDGALTAGSLEKKQEKNDFLATEKEFENFEMTLKWKLEGKEGFVNGGVQFRSERIPNHHEVSGYQADLGAGFDGALYDESRRKKVLAKPSPEVLEKARKPIGEWNEYRIRAEGDRIQLWLNGIQTVDYTETEANIAKKGMIAVQIHGNATSIVRYKDLVIQEFVRPVSAARDRTHSSGFGEAYRNGYGKFPAKATLGDRMMADFFHLETQKLAQGSLASISSIEDWDRQKDVFRQQLFEMLSLDPLPVRTELQATVTGTLDHIDFTVEKLHFQSRPGLYVTANVYVPKGVTKPSPAILYVCGHGKVKIDGISYGNKATYQHHGAWFAQNGYVCIILDSVQLGELEGIHHGTHNKGMWWWNSRGYTSAGAEAWNCIRALDYLQSRPDVDGERIGVTGRSGGGAYSWWIAALDERIQAACPVAGITDLQNHVDDGCVEGHCDCMFMVNTYRWDYSQVAALVAPRPLLICNTDKDRIFPLDGVVRLHSKVRAIYDLHDAPDKLGLLITEGPHKDTQELQVPVMRWFNKWLKKDEAPVANFAVKLFTPQQLKVFPQLPTDEITTRCYEEFTSLAVDSNSFDPDKATALLRAKTFGAWPDAGSNQDALPLSVREISREESEGVRLSVYEFESQPGIQLRFYLAQPIDVAVESLHLEVVDDSNWKKQLELGRVGFGTALKEELQFAGIEIAKEIGPELEKRFKQWMNETRVRKTVYVTFTPRGVGNTALGIDEKYNTHIRRRFMLLGSTIASSQVWDLLRASQAVRSLSGMQSLPIHFHASSEMTEVATFAALFEDNLASLTLANPPRGDKEAPDFLNWSRFTTPKQLLDIVNVKTHVKLKQSTGN